MDSQRKGTSPLFYTPFDPSSLGYRFALGAFDAAERLRQIGSREAVQQMVYDQLLILGATQRTTSQLTNANGQVERQMSRSHHPVEKAMALIPVRDARQSYAI